MSVDVTSLTKDQLDNVIKNHRDKDATKEPLYLEALKERDKRRGGDLDFDTSLSLIRRAAEEGRFLSYKELADASGADWSKVRYSIGSHLWDLVAYADYHDIPMLSAIVVNKPNVGTGIMEPETLKGFIAAAKEIKRPVIDEQKFLRCQQKKVFAWAQSKSKD